MSVLRHASLPLLIAAVLLVGCGGKFSDDSKVLAKVNGEKITEQDYENYLQMRQATQPPIPDKDKEQKVVLDELIDLVLLTQRGAEMGVEQSPEVHFRLKRVRENLLAQEVLRKTFKDSPVTEEDMKKRFEEEVEKSKTEYKARHILVKTEEEAKDVAGQIKAGQKFDDLAKKRSLDTMSGKQGGDLGWISQTAVVPEFSAALKSMKKGEVSNPVQSDFGWHVIKIDDTRDAKLPTWEQASTDQRLQADLRRSVQQQRIKQVLEDLKAKAKVEKTS